MLLELTFSLGFLMNIYTMNTFIQCIPIKLYILIQIDN